MMDLSIFKMILIQNIMLSYKTNVTSMVMVPLTLVKSTDVLLWLKMIGEMNTVQILNMSIVTVHSDEIKFILIYKVICL